MGTIRAAPAMTQTTPPSTARHAHALAAAGFPLLLAIALTLTLRGYNYGGGNHTVYLLAPLQKLHPELLTNDWWTTHTLQYHVAFTTLTAALMRLNVVQPAFLAMYLSMVVLLHVAWLRLVRALGLSPRHYLLSVLLYYLSAGGTGLGSYQFLQDSSFLPGNVANVALLWAIVFWIGRRTWPAAACFALASLFHLNHALIALAFWPLAVAFNYLRRPRGPAPAILHLPSAILAFPLLAALAAAGCTHEGDPKPAPTTRTSEAALKDPYGKWSSDVNTDITGGGTNNLNKDALKRDLDNFWLK